jgi:hypothetical protein
MPRTNMRIGLSGSGPVGGRPDLHGRGRAIARPDRSARPWRCRCLIAKPDHLHAFLVKFANQVTRLGCFSQRPFFRFWVKRITANKVLRGSALIRTIDRQGPCRARRSLQGCETLRFLLWRRDACARAGARHLRVIGGMKAAQFTSLGAGWPWETAHPANQGAQS